MFVTPGVVVDGKLVTHRPGRHQPRHPHPARPLVLRRLGKDRRRSSRPIRSATRWTSAIPGTRPPFRGRRSATSTGKYSWVDVAPLVRQRTSDHLALDTGGGPLARFWATALAGLVDIGYIKATGHERQDVPAQDRHEARGRVRVEDPEVEQRHRARPRPHLLPGVRLRRGATTSSRRRWPSCTRAGPRRGPSSRCPRRRSPAASTRRCAACCRTTW